MAGVRKPGNLRRLDLTLGYVSQRGQTTTPNKKEHLLNTFFFFFLEEFLISFPLFVFCFSGCATQHAES